MAYRMVLLEDAMTMDLFQREVLTAAMSDPRLAGGKISYKTGELGRAWGERAGAPLAVAVVVVCEEVAA